MAILQFDIYNDAILMKNDHYPQPVLTSYEQFTKSFPIISQAVSDDDKTLNLVSASGDEYGKYHYLGIGISIEQLKDKLKDHIYLDTISLTFPSEIIEKEYKNSSSRKLVEEFKEKTLKETATAKNHKTKHGFASQALIHPSVVAKVTDHGDYRAVHFKPEYGKAQEYSVQSKSVLDKAFGLPPAPQQLPSNQP